jgi:hypothetical protein
VNCLTSLATKKLSTGRQESAIVNGGRVQGCRRVGKRLEEAQDEKKAFGRKSQHSPNLGYTLEGHLTNDLSASNFELCYPAAFSLLHTRLIQHIYMQDMTSTTENNKQTHHTHETYPPETINCGRLT